MDKDRLMEEACQELLTYGVWDGEKRLKYLVKKYLLRRKAAPEDLIFWPTGLLAAGLWQYRQEKKEEDETAKEIPGTPIKKQKTKDKILSFGDYIKNKDINTPLDEFVAGACYLDEILNIKKFSLKQLNSKLYPAFGRLASSNIINQAIDRVLIEVHREGKTTQYSINENAWNYHNYDLVRH